MSPRDGLLGYKMCKCFEIGAALSSFEWSSFSFGPKLLLKLEKSVREKAAQLGLSPPDVHASAR